MSEDELVELVERLSLDLESWPDPHPDRRPDDREYSRVTNAERYRIVGTRADAWAAAAVELGLAVSQDRAELAEPDGWRTTRTLGADRWPSPAE